MDDKITSTVIKRALAERHEKDFFLTEVKNGSTYFPANGGLRILDALAIKKSYTHPCFTGYEIKISRSDFLRDSKFYTYENLVNELYLVCPKGMIDRTELPESVGLLYYDPKDKFVRMKKRAIYRKIEYSPEMLLYIIYSRLDSDRLPFYSRREEYCKDYVQHKISNRTLASAVRSRLIADNARMEREISENNGDRIRRERERLNRIMQVLQKYDIYSYSDDDYLIRQIEEKMSGVVSPQQIKYARQHIEAALISVQRLEGKPSDKP